MEVYLAHFHTTKEGSLDIYEEPIKEQVKGCTILGWNLTLEEQLTHINFGSPKVLELMKIKTRNP
jgi:hypothetical protein